jgi:hypothetical protein
VLESLTQLLHWLAQQFWQTRTSRATARPVVDLSATRGGFGHQPSDSDALNELKEAGKLIKFNQFSGQWTGDAQLAFSPRPLLIVKKSMIMAVHWSPQ